MVLAHEIDGEMEHREHAEAEEVDLHQPRCGAVVLVPLQDAAPFHARPLDRAHLHHRPVADDHPARVDAEVAREALHLLGQHQHRHRDVVVAGLDRRPGFGVPAGTFGSGGV